MMRLSLTKSIAWMVLGLLVLPGMSFGEESRLFARSETRLGYQAMEMYYKEPGIMDEKGVLHGGFLSWTGYVTDASIMLGVEVEALKGTLDYSGQYSDGTPLTCGTDDKFASLRLLVGKGMAFGSYGVTPFSGIAGRYWFDRINAVGGYEREITQLYMPLGLRIQHKRGPWTMGGALEGDLLLWGQVESALSQVGPAYSDAVNRQKFASGAGGRVSLFTEYEFDACTLGIEPYFRYWQVRRSEKDRIRYEGSFAHVVEPENRFYMGGIRLYVKF